MATEFRLPELGENIEAGEVVRVAVSAGETVSDGQTVVELETDKAVVEVPSTVSGVIEQVAVKDSQRVKPGDVLFTYNPAEESAKKAPAPEAPQAAKSAAPEKSAPETPEKSAPKETAPEKAVPEKPAPEKPAPEKPAPEKPAPEKPAPEKASAPENAAPEKPPAETPEKPTPEKSAPEKAAPKKPAPEKAAPKPVAEKPPTAAPQAPTESRPEAAKESAKASESAPSKQAELRLPELGENIHSGDVVRVSVQPGEEVSEGQTVLELETDKAVVEVPSSVSGRVGEVKVKVGQNLKVGDLILTLSAAPAAPAPAPSSSAPAETTPAAAKPEAEPGAGGETAEKKASPPETEDHSDEGYMAMARHSFYSARTAEGKDEEEAFPPDAPPETDLHAHPRGLDRHAGHEHRTIPAAPIVRKLAREIGVDIYLVKGSGPGGRIGEDDVKATPRLALGWPSCRISAAGARWKRFLCAPCAARPPSMSPWPGTWSRMSHSSTKPMSANWRSCANASRRRRRRPAAR